MTTLKVYVAAAFAERAHVRKFHEQLRARNHIPTATWCDLPGDGPEPRRTVDEYRAQAQQNDRELLGSDLVILFAAGGREALCEARLALANGIAVVWVGQPCLSAYRRGVVRLPADAPSVLVLDEVARIACGAERRARNGRPVSGMVWHYLLDPLDDDEYAPPSDRTADIEGCGKVLAALGVASTVPSPPPSDALIDTLPAIAFDSSARLACASDRDLDEDEPARAERAAAR